MKTIYVSYDGALDSLGQSQVVPYLLGLAERGVSQTLVSFEKPEIYKDEPVRQALHERLGFRGLRWRPLRYHKWPRLAATLWDVFRGSRVVRAAALDTGARLVHCRGDVAMLMARMAGLGRQIRLLYDMRGFFADERVEAGSWTRDGLLDRAVRRAELGNLVRADGLVTLTEEAWTVLRPRRGSELPRRVIPTCVDLSRFRPRAEPEPPDFGLVYSGSLGMQYLTREMVDFARLAAAMIPGRVLFLSREPDEARKAGATPDWAEVRSATPAEVPQWLRRCRAAFYLSRQGPSKRGAYPTKLAEALASGLPVVCNRGPKEVDDLLLSERVGVLVESLTPEAYQDAASGLARLIADPETSQRCRRAAEAHLSVERGTDAYHGLYRELWPA